MITTRLIPTLARSKYYKNTSLINTSGGNYKNNINTDQYIPPYYIDESGDLVLQNKKFYFNSEYIDDSKIITWDDAVVLSHSHNNKSVLDDINSTKISNWDIAFENNHVHFNRTYLNAINQNLATTSTPSFSGLNVPNLANIWRCNVTGGLTMNNKTISDTNTIGFQPFEKDGVMCTNIITNLNSGGIKFNCPLKIDGSFEMMGSNRDIFSYNYDMNIIHYTHDWNKGSRLTLTDEAVVTDNLNVTGTFNCYELVANKVRSTNGLLYVTDSATVKGLYDNNKIIEFKENNILYGDILLNLSFSGSNISQKKIRITYKPSVDSYLAIYQVWYNNGWVAPDTLSDISLLPTPNDYFVKIDSTDTTRRTGILLSPYSGGYIDFYTGSGDGINKTITTSLGDLNHLNKSNITGNGLYSQNTFLTGKSQKIPKKVTLSGNDGEVNINLFECNWTIVNNSTYGSASGVVIKFDDEGLVAYDGAECTIIIINNNVNSSFYVTDKQTSREVKIWGDTTSFGSGVFLCAAKTVVALELRYCYDLYRKTYSNGRFSSGWVVISKLVYNQ